MKRLALLLAAMGIVSAAALAEAPTLKVTNVGQEIEIENSDGGADIDSIFFANTVGLSYGDWTFAVTGGKFWSYDGDNGVDSLDSRLQIDIWKQTTENLKLGFRYRGQKGYDRYQGRYDYSNGMFWSAGDAWYLANTNDAADNIEVEWFPVGVKYGDLRVGYFLNYADFDIGSLKNGEKESYTEHQLRVYYPLYTGERFSLNFEGRFTIATDTEFKGKAPGYREYDEFGRTRLYIRPSYKVSDSLTVYGYYGYEFKDWKYENGDKRANYTTSGSNPLKGGSDNYQDIGIGWNYTF